MGNPLSPILSDIYIHYFEEKLLSLLNFKCWLQYIDDAFIFIDNHFDINYILQVAISVDSHIQFTFELQDSNTFPFLMLWLLNVIPLLKFVCIGNLFLFLAPLTLIQIILLIIYLCLPCSQYLF